ncbi:Jag N-terminal domain-containing protein, partial [uncultured Subdoligranulum sp.]|uniref:Jag N-terminal domain-containing protein n=1 Tax=uncultured Subdoligranulum sp. TaxID=512298 RepID=UPI00260F2C94
MRTIEMSAKTVEDAVQAACDALGVDRDDINVSYEVLEFPARKLFKTIPAKVRVTVEEPEPEVTEVAQTAAVQETVAAPAPQAAEEPAPAPEPPA